MNAKGRNQTDVRTFGRFNRTQPTVVRIVNVAHLKTRPFTAQTAGSESGNTAFVRDFTEGVGLVEELRQLARAEKRIDDGRQSPRIYQINRRENFIVADVHPFPNRPRHTCQTDAELGVQLLANRAHTAVCQVVNVVNFRTVVDELNDVADDIDDVVFRQNQFFFRQIEFAIDFVATDIAQVVAFITEKQLVNDATRRFVVWRVSAAQLAIDVVDGFAFGRRRVFLQRVVYNRVVFRNAFFLQNNRFDFAVDDRFDAVFVQNHVAFEDNFVPFDGHDFARVFVHEIFRPSAKYPRTEFPTDAIG